MVRQYKKVYDATDYYLVGGEKMAQCFIQSFDASPSQMLKFGLPRLTQYFRSNLKLEQQRLKRNITLQINSQYMFRLIEKVK